MMKETLIQKIQSVLGEIDGPTRTRPIANALAKQRHLVEHMISLGIRAEPGNTSDSPIKQYVALRMDIPIDRVEYDGFTIRVLDEEKKKARSVAVSMFHRWIDEALAQGLYPEMAR